MKRTAKTVHKMRVIAGETVHTVRKGRHGQQGRWVRGKARGRGSPGAFGKCHNQAAKIKNG
jgi:hypothetical protein